MSTAAVINNIPTNVVSQAPGAIQESANKPTVSTSLETKTFEEKSPDSKKVDEKKLQEIKKPGVKGETLTVPIVTQEEKKLEVKADEENKPEPKTEDQKKGSPTIMETMKEPKKKPISSEDKKTPQSNSLSKFGVKNIEASEQEFTYVDELSEQLSVSINDKRYADTVIRCGKNLEHKFYAHRIVLANRSKFFAQYFDKPNLAKDKMERVRFDSPEMFSDIFSKVLEYMYTGSIRLRLDNVLEILSQSENFGIPSLKKLCEKYLMKSTDHDNACHLLEISREYNAKELTAYVLKYIEKAENIKYVLSSDGFKNLRRDNVVEIIKRDSLELAPNEEVLVFAAVAAWAKHTKQMEKASRVDLDTVLSHIRFPLMSSQQLSETVEPTKMVSQELLFEAYRNHVTQNQGNHVAKTEGRFRPRGCGN